MGKGIQEVKEEILKALEEEISCPKCKSNDTYKSFMASLYSLNAKYRCNNCGEYF